VTVGDTLNYTITAENTGTAVLTDVMVTDPMTTPGSITCPTVLPGANCQLVGSYSVTAADVTAGSIANTASAVSVQTPPVSDSETVTLGTPALSVSKPAPANADADGSSDISAGDTLTYTVTATNTGATNLTDVTVTDAMLTPPLASCALVNQGATCTLTGTYVVAATDVAAGSITNTATADSQQTTPETDTQTVSLNAPGLSIDKAAPVNADEDSSADVSVGDTLTYTITATNSGVANLTNVLVTDSMITPSSATCVNLTPGADCVLTGTYTVSAADVAAGSISNTASANSDQTTPVTDTELLSPPSPSHTLSKAAPVNADEDASGDISAGDTLSYTITATNNGSATLTDLIVSDPMISPDQTTCNSVAAGATCVLTGSYTVTAADVSAGAINNTATSVSDQTARRQW